jgi:hypothetical protein
VQLFVKNRSLMSGLGLSEIDSPIDHIVCDDRHGFPGRKTLKPDELRMKRHRALALYLGMIPRVEPEGMLFGKPLHTFPDHAFHLLPVTDWPPDTRSDRRARETCGKK